MSVSSGGTANETIVNDLGQMSVFAGGVANNTIVYFGGRVIVGKYDYYDGYTYGGTISNTLATGDDAKVEVNYGGSAVDTVIQDRAAFHISSGGVATSAVVKNNAQMYVFDGGVADTASAVDWGVIYVFGGASANEVTVNNCGKLHVARGGTATRIRENGGCVEIVSGAEVSFAENTITGMVISSGMMTVHSGTVARATTVEAGEMAVYAGGVADSATVENGVANLYAGGKLTGRLAISENAVVSAYEGSVVDFDLTETSAGDAARVNDLSLIQGAPDYTVTVAQYQAEGTYALAEGAAGFDECITVATAAGAELGAITVGGSLTAGAREYTLALNDGILEMAVVVVEPDVPEDLVGTPDGLSWSSIGAAGYVVEYSTDGFGHALSVAVAGTKVDTFELPSGTYSWRVKAADDDVWAQGEDIAAARSNAAPKVVASDADGVGDLLFANASGTWSSEYSAQHVGVGDWTGTKEIVRLEGKNRIADVFAGSADANVLILTDDANGDALFVDDIYTALPGTLAEQQARIAQLDEIRAGAGNDVIDMTSRRFAYTGGGVTVRGGSGNDTVWANAGDNRLFGDTGNDRLVGASGNDVLAGGSGDDRMHGGGGNDVFTFGANWGVDTVAQLADGSVTLWFASGSESNWNASTLTYADGADSVKVAGVTADRVTLKFGDDGTEEYAALAAAGAFADATSEKIFEDKNKGFLAAAL